MKNTIKYAAAVTALASVLIPMVALAGTLVAPTPPIGGDPVTGGSIEILLNQVASFILTISVIIAVIMIVWLGIIGITQGWEKVKDKLKNVVIGLALIFGVGLIMQTMANIIANQSIN